MYIYMKKFIFIILSIFIIQSMSISSKAMNTEDYDDEMKYTSKLSIKKEQTEDLPFVQQSSLSHSASLNDVKVSWVSSFLSPAKSIAQGVYDVLNYTVHNPQKAMILGVLLAVKCAADTAPVWTPCVCECKYPNGTIHRYDVEWKPAP